VVVLGGNMNPYKEHINKSGKHIRIFDYNVKENELVWHRDREDRIVTALNENDWLFQFEDELPQKLKINESIFIKSGTYHRVIKGNGELKVEIEKL